MTAVRLALALIAAAGLAAACGTSKGSQVQPDVTPAQHAQPKSEYVVFARCMRSHGVSDFPDPITGSGGHPGFSFQGDSSSDLNQNDPAFRRGAAACQHILGHRFRFVFSPSGSGKGA